MGKLITDKRLVPWIIIDGVEYSFYDFGNSQGIEVYGWYPPKKLRQKGYKPIATEEDLVTLINQKLEEGKDVILANGFQWPNNEIF